MFICRINVIKILRTLAIYYFYYILRMLSLIVSVSKSVLSSENQYNITLCPASSRLVTEVSKKIGRDKFVKVSFTWHADEKGSTFIFGSLFVHTNRVIGSIKILRINVIFL